MRIYTRKGDDGSTGLLHGGRTRKDDLRVEAYGTSDEAVAALGLARAAATDTHVRETVLRIQRQLFVLGAQLATEAERWDRLKPGETRVTPAMVEDVERTIDEWTARTDMPREFVVPGESAAGAALDLARAIVRRCERRCVALAATGALPDDVVVPYVNRVADLLFVLARHEEGAYRPLHQEERS